MMEASASNLESHLGYWLRLVSNHVSESFRRKVEAQGVSVSEWVALRMLYDAEPMTPGALATSMAMTKGAVSKIVARLDSAGYLRREGDPRDRRAHRLSLTRRGRAVVPKLARLADKNDRQFFGALSPQDHARLQMLLQELARMNGITSVPVD